MQESTPNLIKCLIAKLQENEKKRQIKTRCKESRNIIKKFKSIAFEIILFGPHSENNDKIKYLSPIDRILAAIFTLRWESKFNEANQLEAAIFKLKQTNIINDEITKNVLTFLLFLQNEGESNEDHIGCISPRWQCPFPKAYKPIIPDGPLPYSCAVSFENNRNKSFYTHYPKELFEKAAPDLEKCQSWAIDPKIFELPPGTNKFVHFPSDDKISVYHQQLSQTVYGALTHKLVDPMGMEVKFEIPELGDVSPPVSLTSHIHGRASTKSQMSDDEGFTEPETPVGYSSKCNKNIWEVVLMMEPRTFYTWEDYGSNEIHREKPYLTESGDNGVNAVENLWQNELKLLHPLLDFPSWKIRTSDDILRDISYVMLGVSSATFWFNDEDEKFIPSNNNIVIGWTHQSLLSLLLDYSTTGTYYYRLRKFSIEPTTGFTQGLIFGSFTQGLRRVLRYYHTLVLTLKPNNNILQFTMATRKIRAQIQNLAELCWCDETKFSTENQTFPTGMRLLTFLYAKCTEAIASDFYLVLLSLLMNSSAPYLKFLHRWIFNGVCNDPFDEFPIKQNGQYLCHRDIRYWSKSFKMVALNKELNWPLIPHELLEEIFVGGKGVNLLKMCAAQHPLCTNQNIEAPELKLSFSKCELESMHWKSERYFTSMEALRKEKRLSWRQFQEQERLKEKVAHDAVVKEAAKTLERIEKRLADLRQAKLLEKRKQMAELQGQIKEVEERRKKEKEMEIEQDKKVFIINKTINPFIDFSIYLYKFKFQEMEEQRKKTSSLKFSVKKSFHSNSKNNNNSQIRSIINY
uniref:Gamma-tubulin complex component n=1 Tax=Strigamia maritima TaxID=126957 RepID=T1J9M5_STRMM